MKGQRLSVIGLGKLGLPMVACLASRGFDVHGVDIDENLVQRLSEGNADLAEPGLAEMLSAHSERITYNTDIEAAVRQTEVSFVVVPTPSGADNTFDPDYVLAAVRSIGSVLQDTKERHLVVLTSTVMPGTTQGLILGALEQASGRICGSASLGLCYSPEFIALGSVIHDFLHPDFLLIGESDPASGDELEALYGQICVNTPQVARSNFVNAELAKLSVNTFVTTKISFANMLARLCERLPGADVDAVTSAVGLDSRIGSKYLRGAIGYGGPCFPRDNLALTALAHGVGLEGLLPQATDQANRAEVRHLADLVKARLPKGGTAGVLGLSYKPETDVVEESPGLLLAALLSEGGTATHAYDPAALANAASVLGDGVHLCQSARECLVAADVVVITTPWPEFRALPNDIPEAAQPDVLIDCWRILDPGETMPAKHYVALGSYSGLHASYA